MKTRLLLVAAALGLAACGTSTAPAAPTSTTSTDTVQVMNLGGRTYLANAAGRALYVFAADTKGVSNCNDSCLTYWPPQPATQPLTDGAGATAVLDTMTRSSGTAQLTVNGLPAYTYSGDDAPGVTNGQGLNASGGYWWLIGPDGTALSTSALPSPATSAYRY